MSGSTRCWVSWYEDAFAEMINGFNNAEVIHSREPWRSLQGVEFATPKWFEWFNHKRLLEPIGNKHRGAGKATWE